MEMDGITEGWCKVDGAQQLGENATASDVGVAGMRHQNGCLGIFRSESSSLVQHQLPICLFLFGWSRSIKFRIYLLRHCVCPWMESFAVCTWNEREARCWHMIFAWAVLLCLLYILFSLLFTFCASSKAGRDSCQSERHASRQVM